MTPEQKREYQRKWREKHPGYTKMKSAEWRAKNLEKSREMARNYYAENTEAYKKRMKDYQLRNLDKFAERSAKWAWANHEACLLRSARDRAKKAGIDFNIDLSDISIPDVCPILGIPIVRVPGKRMPGSASLDRIDNTKGYIKGNVWVISIKANLMKNNASPEDLMAFANWVHRYLNKT